MMIYWDRLPFALIVPFMYYLWLMISYQNGVLHMKADTVRRDEAPEDFRFYIRWLAIIGLFLTALSIYWLCIEPAQTELVPYNPGQSR